MAAIPATPAAVMVAEDIVKTPVAQLVAMGLVSLVVWKRLTRIWKKRRKSMVAMGCLMALPAISDLYELYCNCRDIFDKAKEEE